MTNGMYGTDLPPLQGLVEGEILFLPGSFVLWGYSGLPGGITGRCPVDRGNAPGKALKGRKNKNERILTTQV